MHQCLPGPLLFSFCSSLVLRASYCQMTSADTVIECIACGLGHYFSVVSETGDWMGHKIKCKIGHSTDHVVHTEVGHNGS